MSSDTIGIVLSLAGAGLVAFAYAALLTAWVTPRLGPETPVLPVWVAGLVSAVIAVGVAWASGAPAFHIVIGAATPLLVLAAFVDSKTKRIPNVYTIHLAGVSLIAAAWAAFNFSSVAGWWAVLGGAAGIAATTFVLLVVASLLGGGLGMGDVKLGAVQILLLLVIITSVWPTAIFTSVLAPLIMALLATGLCLIAGVLGIVWIIVRGLQHTKAGFPFGPCLVAAWFLIVAASPLIAAMVPVF